MKTQTLLTNVALAACIAMVGVGCAKNGGSGLAITPNTGAPPTSPPTTLPPPNIPGNNGTGGTTNPGVSQFSGQPGAAVAFKVDNMSVFTNYVYSHPLNNPQNLALNIDLTNIGDGRMAGTVQFAYNDNGSRYVGRFESGTGYNIVSYKNLDKGKSEAEFNRWFNWQGKTVFHGFFQDKYGAVILVIDKSMDLGDGGPAAYVGGSLWFKNFPPTYATQSAEKCWFIRIGPFDCRTFIWGNEADSVIITNLGLYPGNGYQRLGTFDGLEKARAFR